MYNFPKYKSKKDKYFWDLERNVKGKLKRFL